MKKFLQLLVIVAGLGGLAWWFYGPEIGKWTGGLGQGEGWLKTPQKNSAPPEETVASAPVKTPAPPPAPQKRDAGRRISLPKRNRPPLSR